MGHFFHLHNLCTLFLFTKSFLFLAVAAELRGKWQEKRKAYGSKDDINVVRWEQLKSLLHSGKFKV